MSDDPIQALREIADNLERERAVVVRLRNVALAEAALVADQVEAKARPGDGKETAGEIGRRIRALQWEER